MHRKITSETIHFEEKWIQAAKRMGGMIIAPNRSDQINQIKTKQAPVPNIQSLKVCFLRTQNSHISH